MNNQTGILELATMTEDEARAMLERIRWPEQTTCPHCGTVGESTKLNGKSHRAGLYQCRACRKQFTVTTGTIMHRSRLPLVKWILAFHLMCSSKKGISALQLKRQLSLRSYQTAWHLCHRIRFAMANDGQGGLFGEDGGIVEADETFVGGKARRGEPKDSPKRIPLKVPVVALVDRKKGRAKTVIVTNVNGDATKEILREHVDPSATIMTDDSPVYDWTGDEFAGGHHSTVHSHNEFSRRGKGRDGLPLHIHSNTAESFFSLLKRGHVGAFHKWGPQHVHRYCSEFDFRWNHRKEADIERTVAAIKAGEGRRLTYDTLPTGSAFQ